MVLSSEGLHLLSNVAVWNHTFETINDKNTALWHRYYTDVKKIYIIKENHREWINNDKNKDKKMKKEYSTSDGWEVFRFQISEEHRINQTFNTLNDFLDYWCHEHNNRQESSRLKLSYMKKHSKKQSGQGPTGVQQEALERYQNLSYTDKAIYRAVAKEYFRKKVVYVNS
jgi:hypothetical protein